MHIKGNNRPWNSSLSSYSSTSSNYRSRYGSDTTSTPSSSTATPKFSTITPSSYRPSYSSTSGTYRASRAPPIASTAPITKTTPSYTRTYSSLGKSSTEDAEKPKSYTRTLSNLGRDKAAEDEKEKSKLYTRSYTTMGRTRVSDDKEKERKEPSPPKRTTSTRYSSTKDLTVETRSRLATTVNGTTNGTKKEEKGPPITFNTRYKVTGTRGRSRDPSPTVENGAPQTALQRLTAARDARDPSPATKSNSATSVYSRLSVGRSRDPSPVSKSYTDSAYDKSSYSSSNLYGSANVKLADVSKALKADKYSSSSITTLKDKSRASSPSSTTLRSSITSISSAYSRSRDPSPVDSKYNLSSYRLSTASEKQREPSPSVQLNKLKARESSPLSVSSYRRTSREPSPSEPYTYTSSLSNSSLSRQTLSKPSTTYQNKSPDLSISYMTANEATNSRSSRASYINRFSPQKEKPASPSMIPLRSEPVKVEVPPPPKPVEADSSDETSSEEESTEESTEEEEVKPEAKIMIQVTTITRGTSPTPPGTTTSRVRRIEVAKTIEKVRQRPLQGPPTFEKATQSDRMDDSTRYSRYAGTTASRSIYSPYSSSPTSYSSRVSGLTAPRYNRESASATESDKSESTSQISDKFNYKQTPSEDTKNSSLSARVKERSREFSSKSATPEVEKVLPPQSPTKSNKIDSLKSASSKTSNKDFRKSALNMGPTDRVRRSKSNSSDNTSPTVEKTRAQFQLMVNGESKPQVSLERSESVESESSTDSGDVESQIEQKKIPEPTKEEIINHKIEEAKSFLLKTLGNANAVNAMKSPSPKLNDLRSDYSSNNLSCSADYPSTTTSLSLDFSNLKKTVSCDKPWLMEDNSGSRTPPGSDRNDRPGSQRSQHSERHDEEQASLLEDFSEMTLKATKGNNGLHDEKAWWCKSPVNQTSDNQAFAQNNETVTNKSWGQETGLQDFNARPKMFISRHTNIDDLLGGSSVFNQAAFDFELITPDSVKIHEYSPPNAQKQSKSGAKNEIQENSPKTFDDAAVQVFKDGDLGTYLDLESSLAEQTEEVEGINDSRKNSLVVRTQLSVRVHSIIDKLLTSEGKELRRALFSLKQIFQEDKDLVHGFVALGGLNCLVRIGNEADQNYQNYILRALGQVMLYVDGMNGVMKHESTVQWLYSLISSKYRLVVKTALKLLLVFVEYSENNCYLLVNAIQKVDSSHGAMPWSVIMKLLKDYDNADTELLIYATSLINKALSGLSEQDSFYDETDYLEQQGIESVIQRYMSRTGTDLDLLDQFQLYEAALRFEDGTSDDIKHFDDKTVRKTLRACTNGSVDKRKSRRHSTTAPAPPPPPLPKYEIVPPIVPPLPLRHMLQEAQQNNENDSSSSGGDLNGFDDCKVREGVAGVTPALRKRRERAERQRTFQRDQDSGRAEENARDSDENENRPGKVPLSYHSEQLYATHKIDDNLIKSNLSLNNKNGFHSVTNKQVHLIHHMADNFCKNNQIESSKSSTKSFGKSNLNFENNKNMIYNQNLNKADSKANKFMSEDMSESSTDALESCELKLIGINQLKSIFHAKRLIMTNVVDKWDSLLQLKLKTAKQDEVNDTPSDDKLVEASPNGADCQMPVRQLKPLDNAKRYPQSCTRLTSENFGKTTKINYVPRQFCGLTSSNSHARSGNNFHDSNLHEKEENATNKKGIPNIIINGSASDFNDKMFNAGVQQSRFTVDAENDDKKLLQQLMRDQTVKDLTQKLSNLPLSPQEDKPNRVGDLSGLISKAKEELAKNKNKIDSKATPDNDLKKPEPKKSEIEMHWEELIKNMDRDLMLCDLDFRDLTEEDEPNVLMPRGLIGSSIPPPPPLSSMMHSIAQAPPLPVNGILNGNSRKSSLGGELTEACTKKSKKTVKLFWKEVREDLIPTSIDRTIWDELPTANVDTSKLEHLFESRAKDMLTKEKQQELNKSKEIIVLDHKRSNAINIAMTKLPPPRAIKTAILKMDSTVVTREGIDKLLNMLPTDEERGKILEAQVQYGNELPLGSAEQFLLTLSSISELSARLKLWAFRLDFENIEKEIAEPLMDLKQGVELLRANITFKCILAHLLSVGCFLNGQPVKGFQIEYLAKVPEVKDTVHKHSLLHHLCHMVMESETNTTDLYSEIGPVTRASKADFNDLAQNIKYLETECKASWDRLKLISKHETAQQLKQKLIDFLADCAERIIILDMVHRRVINRYHKFLLWLGVPSHGISESKPNEFCRVLSEFALEYRTTRERVLQQIEKKANHRERNKTRGKLIVDVAKLKSMGPVGIAASKEEKKDAELRQLLGSSDGPDSELNGTFTFRRRRPDSIRSPSISTRDEVDGDDEILESLVKATKATPQRPVQRERKRTRNAERKSLRRTLKNGLTEDEKLHIQQSLEGC